MGSLVDREEDDNACCADEHVTETTTTDYMKFVHRKPGSPGFLSSSEAKHPVFEHLTTFISPFGGKGASIHNKQHGLLLGHKWRCCRCQRLVNYRHCVVTENHCVCLYCYCEARVRFLGCYLWLARHVMDAYNDGGGITDNALLDYLVKEFVEPLLVPCLNEQLITHWYQTKLDETVRHIQKPCNPIPLSLLFAVRLHERTATTRQFTLVFLRDIERQVLPGCDIGIVCDAFQHSIIACRRRRRIPTEDDTKWVWTRGNVTSRCNRNWGDFLEYIYSFTCQYPQFERLDYNVVDNDSTK